MSDNISTSNAPVSNTDSVDTTDTSTLPQYEGVSNPPDGGQVATNDAAPETASASTPQPPVGQQGPQQQGPQQGPQQQSPSAPGKPDANAPAPQAPAPDVSQHPSVQKAGLIHTIAQTLAGGPRYAEKIDANTGEMTRTPVPVSKTDIGLAIAMEAISGSLAGLSQKGPGAVGRAGEAGYQQALQEKQQQQQQQDAQAQADFARHYQVLDTNMRLHQNAVQLGRLGFEANDSYVQQFKPLAELLQKQYPQAVQGVVAESDLSKYHVTKDSAIPIGVVKRVDPKTGEQVTNQFGEPQWDVQYLVVDPHFKSGDFLSAEDKAMAAKYRLPGFADSDGKPSKLPDSLPMRLSMAAGYKAKIGALRLAEGDIKDYYGSLNDGVENGNVPLQLPTMHDQSIQTIVDDAANRYGVPKALVRAVAMQESGGNPNAKSPKGAVGVMQLMPDTAKTLGVSDPTNAQQNIDGGVRYLKQLLDQYKGDTKLALAAYNAGPGNVTDHVPDNGETKQYVDAISKAVGLDNPQTPQPGEKDAYEPVDLAKAVQDDPTLVDALMDFQPYLNATSQNGIPNYSKAIGELGAKNPQEAGKIMALYGGSSLINHYDQQAFLKGDALKKKAENDELLKRQAQERADKNAENEAAYYADAKAIAGDPNDPASGDMMALDKLISQRTADRPKVYDLAKKINPNFNPANAELKLDKWKDFTTDSGKASQQIKSFNTLFDHIGAASEAVNNLRNTGSPLLNKPLNAIRKDALGDPNVTSVLAAIQPVKSEFMTFLNNNHALTESDKKAGDDLLAMHFSTAQLQEQLKRFAETSAYRLKETNNDWKRVFGRNFPGLVSPDALKTIKMMPELTNIIGDMDTGGTIFGSSDGRGRPGQTVAQAIGLQSAPQIPQGVRQAQPNEKPVWVNGKFAGYSADGKTFSYQYQGQ